MPSFYYNARMRERPGVRHQHIIVMKSVIVTEFRKGRSRNRSEMKREEILDVCYELYSKNGPQAVNFGTVSEMTSLTRPALYRYYGCREDMLLDLLKRRFSIWSEAVLAALDSEKNCSREGFCRIISEYADRNETLFALLSDQQRLEKGCSDEMMRDLSETTVSFCAGLAQCIVAKFPGTSPEAVETFVQSALLIASGAHPATHRDYRKVRILTELAPGHPLPDMRHMIYNSLMAASEGFACPNNI